MRILQLHCDYIRFKPMSKALKNAPELAEEEKAGKEYKNVLVAFTSFEVGDNEAVVQQAARELEKHFNEVKADLVVTYPYAHLSNNLAKPDQAIPLLNKFLELTRIFAPNSQKSPFGYYKEFEFKCKGHPLAELSKTINSETLEKKVESLGAKTAVVEGTEKKEEIVSDSIKQEAKTKSEFFILTPEGELTPAEKFNYKTHDMLKALADYEIMKVRTYAEEPPHIKLMKEHHLVTYEPASDSGNMRWMPKGLLIKRMLEKAVTDICVNYGAMQVETPIMYDYQHPALKSYLNRFPARQYIVKSDEKDYFLRFAACFGGLIFAHDLTISYKNLPLPIYEITHYSFRREQSGELAGLKRLRAFTMPDMHTLCADFEQAKKEFEKQYHLCLDWNNDLEIKFEVAFRAQKDFFNENKEWYLRMVKKIGKPIMLELFDLRYAYFITKFEFNFIDNAMKAAGLSTVQIDIENGERFDINYTDENGKRNHPLVLHASIPGAVDRVLFAILEREARKMKESKTPTFPLWLAPTQVRIIPISDKQNDFCEKLLEEMQKGKVRVDFDDRGETFQNKIRNAEKEWIPFIVIVGEKEVVSGNLSVRIRTSGKQELMHLENLAGIIEKETSGKPFERVSLSDHLSKRPVF
ncbi:TPA: threonine--tRNA ligase [Candidatus Micrarchaeota archaeon]|nr:threonine--tRNA ligase [Candidatus Micrarchaeota archaeon]